jgi:hypothetical protein
VKREPEFDELLGAEPAGAERERLRRAHELLVQAGPPPELTPALERGPTRAAGRAVQRRQVKRRAVLLLAAAVAAGAMFAAGYAVADHGTGSSAATTAAWTLALKGTAAVPRARATLEILPAQAGNWPMTLSVTGLPKLPPRAYYEVYLVRGRRPWASCGSFVVAGSSRAVTLTLNAPYALQPGDSWVVTRTRPGETGAGTTVLRPA